MAPNWLILLSWAALAIGFGCAAWLVFEQFRHRQHMWIMHVVWPVTALYAGPLAIWAYYAIGLKKEKPFWQSIVGAVTHCGAGCTIGDILSENVLFYTGFTAFAGGELQSYFVMDFVLAYLFGIAFQYFTIAPMRGISGWNGIWAAVKADTLSLTAFEMGLFGWMALSHFILFRPHLMPNSPAYWFMMQIGMCLGALTSYPMNWWLVKRGLKEEM